MSDAYIVRNCAPTLAGLKTGSLFTCPVSSRTNLRKAVRDLNRRLGPKGLRVIPLRCSRERALIYLYRPDRLAKDLTEAGAASLLQPLGYDTDSYAASIVRLVRKLHDRETFPHEIGLFLGYPAEDVRGFMENGACGCKCVGCWKVYGDAEAAKKLFALYKKCTSIYCKQWEAGADIVGLAVAG